MSVRPACTRSVDEQEASVTVPAVDCADHDFGIRSPCITGRCQGYVYKRLIEIAVRY